ncbi:MAG: cyanophycin synthetase, partial [bacterium]|nr:cyanophycin synthetase [bacterium]
HCSFALKRDGWREKDGGIEVVFQSGVIRSPLPGEFNAANILAAATWADADGIALEHIKQGIESVGLIRGRAERIHAGMNQTFDVVVDYAHTPESLEAIYKAFGDRRKVCVLGNTGGGRDRWKRPKMAAIAEHYCDSIVLTNEDPYDEDPSAIISEMVRGMINKNPRIIMDRREAIRAALSDAHEDDVVLITGKGTDPYIMGVHGTKTPWDDATVARDELSKILTSAPKI